jgi:hypothetical protein
MAKLWVILTGAGAPVGLMLFLTQTKVGADFNILWMVAGFFAFYSVSAWLFNRAWQLGSSLIWQLGLGALLGMGLLVLLYVFVLKQTPSEQEVLVFLLPLVGVFALVSAVGAAAFVYFLSKVIKQ